MRARSIGLILLAVLTLAASRPLSAQVCEINGDGATIPKTWIDKDYSGELISADSLALFSSIELSLVRGVIFGRHGRIFRDSCIQGFLEGVSWYHADSAFTNSRLTAMERRNLDVVRDYEASLHNNVELGDLRYWMKKRQVIPRGAYPVAQGDELRLLIAEIAAIHGKRFDDVPWMQAYFEDRYWYVPRAAYNDRMLSAAETRNIAIFDSLLHERGTGIKPGEMGRYANVVITDSMLRGTDLSELRLLRNEIYARHGYRFKTPYLAEWFSSEEWYTVRPDFEESDLTPIDRANIATITAQEDRFHQALSTTLLDKRSIGALSFESARKLRNEIYARHGRSFKDPSLQGYFSSLPWYHPSNAFKDSDLNPVEEANAKFLLAYQDQAYSEIKRYEG